MAKKSRDSETKNELIMGRLILIDINKGEYKVKIGRASSREREFNWV